MAIPNKLSKVSIIITTYNRSALLRLAVESVLAQTYPAIEIIVVDDGSTDDTETIIKQYAQRVIYIKQTNQGVSAARNAGFRASSGEYINFLDDDDLFVPIKIERQVQMFETHPDIGLVHCRYYYTDEKGEPIDKVGPLPEGEVLKKLICGCFLWLGAPLIRRSLEQVGLFDEETWSACEDWDLWLRIAERYPFACVQEPLGCYRMLSNSRMINNFARLKNGIFVTLERAFANPQLPGEITAVKSRAYSNMHLELSFLYYAAKYWDEAQQSLIDSIALRPGLLDHPEKVLQLIYLGPVRKGCI